jgi:hypothetical protein
MDLISRQELTTLLEGRGDNPHVSIFIPTVRAGAETQQNPIRFKNMLREAQNRLVDKGLEKDAAEAMLEPARALVEDFDFWQHQADGLAMFLADGFFRTYRLPLEFNELAAVEDRFHVKSLLPLFNVEAKFFVLGLSQNQVRLYQGDRYRLREVPLTDVPQSLADALGYDLTEPHLQMHTGGRAANASRSPIFHGQGAGEEDAKDEIRKFFHILDRGLHELLGGAHTPLVLAGVDYLLPIYREATSYAHTVDGGVSGNPEGWSPQELHAKAWEVVEPLFRQQRADSLEKYGSLKGTGRATGAVDEVVPAAVDGRVDTLFVPRGVRHWGRFDRDERRVEHHDEQRPDSEDLLDFAAVHTFLNSGKVYAVTPDEIPDGGEAAAIFRY